MSAIFFKFKSQREPQRITFDGTHLSVFETKREIIRVSQLGDGTDFDLAIYHEDTNEEYDDDTAIIPRSTTVIARRLPAAKHGQGRAARYVSGRMPVTAKNSHRVESTPFNAANKQGTSISNGALAMEKAQTEEERIAAMLQLGGDQWEEQKQQMANAAPIYRPGGMKGGKTAPVPDHPPPPEYVCYRCGVKGHWIQACPTNHDPKFDGRPRVVRTVGIPRSFLQQVEKPTAAVEDGLTDDARQPSSRWVDSEGNAVAAVPDSASWELYQAKAKASAARENVDAIGSKELQDLGLECPIDKRLFVDPMKTPCCSKTYCHECIENALINSDLVCPGCSTENILLDNLIPDEDAVARTKAYEEEKKIEKKTAAAAKASTPPKSPSDKVNSPSPTTVTSGSPKSPSSENKRKRTASDDLHNDRRPDGPKAMKRTDSNKTSTGTPKLAQPQQQQQQAPAAIDQSFIDQMNALAQPNGANTNYPAAPFQMPMGMPDMMGMGNAMSGMSNAMGMPPMMLPGFNSMGMPGMLGMPGMPGMLGMPGMPGMNMNGMTGMNGMPQMWPMNSMNGMNGMQGMNSMNGMQGMNGMNGMNGMYPGNNNMNGMGYSGPQNQQGWMGNNNGGWAAGANNNGNHNAGMMYNPQNTQQQQQQRPHQRPPGMPPTGPAALVNKQAMQHAAGPSPGYQNHNQNQNFYNGAGVGAPSGPGFGVNKGGNGSNEEESAYIRQPVNPARHAARARKVRPMDFREV